MGSGAIAQHSFSSVEALTDRPVAIRAGVVSETWLAPLHQSRIRGGGLPQQPPAGSGSPLDRLHGFNSPLGATVGGLAPSSEVERRPQYQELAVQSHSLIL